MRNGSLLVMAVLFGLSAAVSADDASPAKAGEAQVQEQAQGTGVVKAIDKAGGSITLAHDPIEAFNWPKMTMKFKVSDPALLDTVAVGNKVEFSLQGKDMSKSRVTAIKVTG